MTNYESANRVTAGGGTEGVSLRQSSGAAEND